jgi:uncharacterized protein YbjT (DUF2867 family)
MNNILILGGTGNTGKHIVDLLYKFSNHNIIVIARDKKNCSNYKKII